ncbi:molybdopterin-dependent oxidoreductase [Aquihabitans daechungensis]|uniref:molybdopterin-dependent oxidoreductase n=1 Tax=Aquihabitans daechungensis TaxID=1052257 RepID=UPI003B9ECE76
MRTEPDAPSIGRLGALAGALGAAAALAVIEVVALLDSTGDSVTEATGNAFIDAFAASLKEIAVVLFGTNDKAALLIGTAIVAMLIGAWLGMRALSRPVTVVVGFTAFAVLGIVMAWRDPLASKPVSVLASLLGAAVGVAVTLGLARRWQRAVQVERAHPAAAGYARRRVLVDGGIAAAALLIGVGIARSARESARTTASRVTRKLPRATPKVTVPAGTLDKGSGAVAGITPYVTPTDDFYRIDTAFRAPIVDESTWSLTIKGMVDREITLTYDDILARDLIEVPITMLCVSNEIGNHLVGNARWSGVLLTDLLQEAGVQDGAEQVMGESVDGFTAGFPVEVALDGRDAMLVVGMNGHPLPAEHGFPARLVIPGIYGYVSATKWLKEIRLTTWDEEGFWVPRGWSRLGPIKTSSRIDVPHSGEELEAGPHAIAGVAWAPTIGIQRVEVQVDDGPWRKATLGPVASADTWVQWWLEWDAKPGDHRLRARAIDGDGRTQTAEIAPPAPDGATGLHTIQVKVG